MARYKEPTCASTVRRAGEVGEGSIPDDPTSPDSSAAKSLASHPVTCVALCNSSSASDKAAAKVLASMAHAEEPPWPPGRPLMVLLTPDDVLRRLQISSVDPKRRVRRLLEKYGVPYCGVRGQLRVTEGQFQILVDSLSCLPYVSAGTRASSTSVVASRLAKKTIFVPERSTGTGDRASATRFRNELENRL